MRSKRVIFETVVESALRKILSLVPLLRLPIIKPFITKAIMGMGEIIFEELDRHFTFREIDKRTEKERKAYDKAKVKLDEAETKEEVDEAYEEFKNAARDFMRFN